jgi:predicted nucleotidyltransferase component of viral defense system
MEARYQRKIRGRRLIIRQAIIEWTAIAPWADMRQVEQDLIIGRALTEIFCDNFLSSRLAFRGGTALHRLYLAPPIRYSEDIDLVQTIQEPIGPVLNKLREILNFLGKPIVKQKTNNNTLLFKTESTYPPEEALKLKVEINCKEHFSVKGLKKMPYEINNSWYSGKCVVITYDFNELIGTKIRALYQRRKGRDLFDLYFAARHPQLDVNAALKCFREYMLFSGERIPSGNEYYLNLEEKMSNRFFTSDMDGLLRPDFRYDPFVAYVTVRKTFIAPMDVMLE